LLDSLLQETIVMADGWVGLRREEGWQFGDCVHDAALADVVLVVGGVQIQSHRILLQAASQYLQSILSLVDQEEYFTTIILPSIKIDVMKRILDWIYTGQVLLRPGCVAELISAAQYLQVKSLVDELARFFQTHLVKETTRKKTDDHSSSSSSKPVSVLKRNLRAGPSGALGSMHNVPSTRKAEQSTVYTSGALDSMYNVPSTRKAEQITVYSAPAKVKTRVHRHPYNKPGDIVQRSIKCSGLADKTVYILQDKREDDDVNESVIQDVSVDCSEAEHRSKEPGLSVLDILNQDSAEGSSASDSSINQDNGVVDIYENNTYLIIEDKDDPMNIESKLQDLDSMESRAKPADQAYMPGAGPQYRKNQSKVWDYFGKMSNGESVICLKCGVVIKYTSNTSTMARHIKRFHQKSPAGADGVPQVQPSQRETRTNFGRSPKKGSYSQRSVVWRFYEKIGDRVRCNLCEKMYAFSHNTTNLRVHLNSQHKHAVENTSAIVKHAEEGSSD